MKNKTLKKSIVAIMIFSMVAMYGYMPMVNAASMTDASDLITDSDALAGLVTHTIVATTGVQLDPGDTITYTFEGSTGIAFANATCPSDAVESGSGQDIVCTVGTLIAADTVMTLILTDTTNPAIGSYKVDILSETAASEQIEIAQVRFFIVDDVTMHAHVEPTLQLVVDGTSTGAVLNGTETCDADTTATTTDFGTLIPDTPKTICQTLSVTTNATGGFNVTVEQDNELTNSTLDDINSFNNSDTGTGSTTSRTATTRT